MKKLLSLPRSHRLLTPTLSRRTPRPTVSHRTFLFTCREFGLHFLLQRRQVKQGKSLLPKVYFKGLRAPYASGKCRWERPAVAHLVPSSTSRKALPLSRGTRAFAGAPRLCREHKGLGPREPALGCLVRGAPCATPPGPRNLSGEECVSQSVCLSVVLSSLFLSPSTSVCPCL